MKKTFATPNEATNYIKSIFPFQGYMINNEKYVNEAETVLKYIPKKGKILDFGCGPMDVNAILSVLGYECTGYDDLSDEWHKLPANKKKILDFIADLGMTLNEAKDGDFSYEKETFDMFMNHDVMEHLHDSPKDMLLAGLEAVKPEGYLYVTVPNAVNIKKRFNVVRGVTNHPPYNQYYWYPKPWRGHVREYSRQDLVTLAEYLDCDIIELRAIHHMMEKVPPGFIGLYKFVTFFFPDWRDTWQLVAKKRKNWNPKKELTPSEFQELMGLTGNDVMDKMYGTLVEKEDQ